MKQFIILFLVLNLNLFSQNISIKSKIIDINNSPISNANIICGNNGTFSNNLGYFKINCLENQTVSINHISYESKDVISKNIKNTVTLNNKDIFIETVIVDGGLNNRIKLNNVDIIKDKLIDKSNHHFEDIINSTPILNYSAGTSRPRYFQIRGIGELSQFSGEGAPHFYVSTIIDNIDFSGIGGIGLLEDINQIEIFKGPQSTSFGPNAMAGVINFISNKPTSKNTFNSSITVANKNTSKISIILNNPINKKIYFRTAFSKYKTNGFIFNDYTKSNNTNGKDEELFKISLLRKANEKKTINYNFYLINLNNKYNQWAPDNNGYTTYTDYQGYDKQKTLALSIKRIIKLNKGTLTRISTYSDNKITYSYDGDWGNNDYWSNPPYNWDSNYWGYDYSFPDSTNRIKKQKSKEIRFSNDSMTIGGYFSELKETDLRYGWIFAGADSMVSSFDIKNSSIYIHFNDNSENKTQFNATFRLDNYITKNNLSYRIYNWDTFSYDSYNDIETSIKDDFLGINLNFIHRINKKDNLQLILSNGYKTAGINQSPNFTDYRYYDTEKAQSIELGYQQSYSNHSISITAFHIKRINPQLRVFGQLNMLDPTSFDYGTVNGKKGYSRGIDVSIVKRNKTNTIYNSFSLLDTHLDEFSINPFPNIESAGIIYCGGRESAHSPRFKYNIKIDFDLNDLYNGLGASIESNYIHKFYFDDQNNHLANSRNIINFNLKYLSKSKIKYNIWAKNLANTKYETRGYTFALEPDGIIRDYKSYGDRRSFGITIEFSK